MSFAPAVPMRGVLHRSPWLAAPLSLFQHRVLLRSMVRRELEMRYRGSLLGGFWALASPLFLVLCYTYFFGVLLQIRWSAGDGLADFGLFLVAGMLPWMAISGALGQATGAILNNRSLVKKVVFPLELLPANLVFSMLVDQLVGQALVAVIVFLVTDHVPVGAVLVPLILVPQLLLTIGLAWLLASLSVFLRDLGQAIGVLLTAWMFLTPIFYPPHAVPEQYGWILALNPLTAILAAYRAALLGVGGLDANLLAYPLLVGGVVFLLGGYWFIRTKHAFADVL